MIIYFCFYNNPSYLCQRNRSGTGLNKYPDHYFQTNIINKYLSVMAKKKFKKASKNGKEKELDQKVQELMERGDVFGQSIIGLIAQFAYDWKGIGVAAVGMAKALAALKAVAREVDVDIDKLYKSELAHFENEYFLLGFEMVDLNEK